MQQSGGPPLPFYLATCPSPSPLLTTFLEGYIASVLLYGAGATGKTHTLLGPDRGSASRLFGQLVNRAAVIRPGPCPVTTGQTLAQLANN